jgi:hypothetical protein
MSRRATPSTGTVLALIAGDESVTDVREIDREEHAVQHEAGLF